MTLGNYYNHTVIGVNTSPQPAPGYHNDHTYLLKWVNGDDAYNQKQQPNPSSSLYEYLSVGEVTSVQTNVERDRDADSDLIMELGTSLFNNDRGSTYLLTRDWKTYRQYAGQIESNGPESNIYQPMNRATRIAQRYWDTSENASGYNPAIRFYEPTRPLASWEDGLGVIANKLHNASVGTEIWLGRKHGSDPEPYFIMARKFFQDGTPSPGLISFQRVSQFIKK